MNYQDKKFMIRNKLVGTYKKIDKEKPIYDKNGK